MEDEGLLTKKEVQAYLRCSHQTLHRLMTQHSLPYHKIARRVLFRRGDVDTWLEAHRVVSAEKASRGPGERSKTPTSGTKKN